MTDNEHTHLLVLSKLLAPLLPESTELTPLLLHRMTVYLLDPELDESFLEYFIDLSLRLDDAEQKEELITILMGLKFAAEHHEVRDLAELEIVLRAHQEEFRRKIMWLPGQEMLDDSGPILNGEIKN